ncbi:hypothetical protein Tco_0870302 [Tanacetum coccineum]
MFEEKVKTPPYSPPITVIDPNDQPMWSSTRTVAPIPSSAIIQLSISNNFHIKGTHMQMIWDNQFDWRIRSDPHRHVADFLEISSLFHYGENQEEAVMLRTFPFSLSEEATLDDPTQGILDGGEIFFYNTPNEAFKILEDKVLFKLDFTNDYKNNPEPKTIVPASGSNINPD